MCGRYYVGEKELMDFRRLVEEVERNLLVKHGEIYPGDTAPIFVPHQNSIKAHAATWGFPSYNKSNLIINARVETLTEKPMFNKPFINGKRCLVPAQAFFEWKKESNKKTKYKIQVENEKTLYMAGVYWFYKNKDNVNEARFVIITTSPNSKISDIHNRMPVIIDDTKKDKWLFEADDTLLESLCIGFPAELMSVSMDMA